MPKEAPRKHTTLRMRQDLLDGLDKEVVKEGYASRTRLMEHIMSKWLKGRGHSVQQTRPD